MSNTSVNQLIDFFNKVIIDIENKSLSESQILFISQFYINYNTINNSTSNSEKNSKLKFSPSIYDLLTAGITFYSTLTDTLDIDLELKDE